MKKKEMMKWSFAALVMCFVFISPCNTFAQMDFGDSDHLVGPSTLTYPVSGSQRTSDIVMEDIVIPPVTTTKEKAVPTVDNPRMIAGYARYEMINDDILDFEGNLYGVSLGMAWDVDSFSYGFVIPYDMGSIDIPGDDIDVNRYGAVGFFQYNAKMAENWNAGLTGNVHSFWMDDETDTIRVIGAGASVAFGYDAGGVFVPSLALSYQYNEDDTDNQYGYQHLFKAGVDAGFRLGEAAVASLFCIWNVDISDYMRNADGSNFGDIGVEARYNITDTFTLNGGYKAVVNLEDYTSNTFFAGGIFRF